MHRLKSQASILLVAVMFTLAIGLMASQSDVSAGTPPPANTSHYISHYVQPPQPGGGGNGKNMKLTDDASDGALQVIRDGKAGDFCPLKHTDVQAEISGFLARVTVKQQFVNTSEGTIEAIYTFPLPSDSAVDDMTLRVGDRVIKGDIKKREEARKIYEQARQAGHTAALLDQERPNIFTQSVANIAAGATVEVEISYSETLKYDAGNYEFVYPMVVGPRYIPGNATGRQGGGWSPDTDQVPDASRITPPVAGVHYGVKGSRAGHDISLTVKLDAGVVVQKLDSLLHEVDVQHTSAHSAIVRLKNEGEIPNRDFVLKYQVAGSTVQDALLTHADPITSRESRGGGVEGATTDGYFTFILQPPDRVREEDATPRELIFVLDTSGSMSGFPIETGKKVMIRAIENLRAGDTFNLITFSGDEHILFPQPVPATSANIKAATSFLSGQRGGGGTEMMKAIRAALGDDASSGVNLNTVRRCGQENDCKTSTPIGQAVRVVVFMTDGYVGNDMEIIGAIQKHPEARVFSFGIGSSVNRFLLDGMARAGRGEVEYVTRTEDAPPAADRLYERVHTPVLTDVIIDWGTLPVHDVLPSRPLDLFSVKPVVLTGRYSGDAKGTIHLRGKQAGKAFDRAIKVELQGKQAANGAVAQLWARNRISDLMSQDWSGMQQGNPSQALREQITQLGLDYRLMTQFTSFVAVEEQTVVENGQSRTIQVPVEMPQGVSPEGVFGKDGEQQPQVLAQYSALSRAKAGPMSQPGFVPNPNVGTPGYNGPVGRTNEVVEVTDSASMVNSTSSSLASQRSGRPEGTMLEKLAVNPGRTSTDALGQAGSEEDKDLKRLDREFRVRKTLASKLHPSLLAVYDCWVQSGRRSNATCAGLKDGKVNIKLWLTSADSATLRKLELAGLALPSKSSGGNTVAAPQGAITGTVEISKLAALAALPEVKLAALL